MNKQATVVHYNPRGIVLLFNTTLGDNTGTCAFSNPNSDLLKCKCHYHDIKQVCHRYCLRYKDSATLSRCMQVFLLALVPSQCC